MYIKIGIAACVVAGALFTGWAFVLPVFTATEVQDAAPVTLEQEMERLSDTVLAVDESMPEPMPADMPSYPVVDTPGHPAAGEMKVIDTPEGQVLRFENFSTINGPQLHLYLASDLEATEFIDLGPVRGTSGNINYAVPEGVDLADYPYVMHWCVPFKVLFNYAQVQ